MAVSFVCLRAEDLVAPLTALACARQRRTRRLDNVAFLIGHAMGGRPAERLARRLGLQRRNLTKTHVSTSEFIDILKTQRLLLLAKQAEKHWAEI